MTEYRKSKPGIDVFVNKHRFTLPMLDVNMPGGKKASATYGADILFENDTKKLSISANAAGAFHQYVTGNPKGKRAEFHVPGKIGTLDVRVNFPDAPSVKAIYLHTIRQGEKSAFPRWDADALLLGSDYDTKVGFHAVVSMAKVKYVYGSNAGETVSDLSADDARMSAAAKALEAELVADLTK